MVNRTQIHATLLQHFEYHGNLHIDDQGLISCEGDVVLQSRMTELPVQFDQITGNFDCYHNDLTTLKGVPIRVGGHFRCYINQLTDLTHAPERVGGMFNAHTNRITDLTGAPRHVGGHFNVTKNPIKSLAHAPEHVGMGFVCDWSQQLGILRLLNYPEVTLVKAPDAVWHIMNKYEGQGKKAALSCAAELVKAGYKDNARW